jgi:cytochrome d ubiquinol oxidase subunit II
MNYPFDLHIVWFILVGFLFTGYAILDGFDLGVGAILLFAKGDLNRRIVLNSIGPVWNGNEVWLIVAGGALFAAFPDVYATVFSGFYLPFMLLLAGLIFRAAAIEFRSKEDSPHWRAGWDISFCVGSVLIALLIGVAMGNIIVGVPIGSDKEYQGGFFNLLNPYALITGVTTVALFTMHGSIYLVMKTEGELQQTVKGWVKNTMIFFGVSFGSLTMATFVFAPQMADKIRQHPWLFLLPLVTLLIIANVPREIARGKEGTAFLSSCLTIASLLSLFGLGMFPRMVPSTAGSKFDLTIYNSSSSDASLTTMFSIALLGMPFVLAYTIAIYSVFNRKTSVKSMHY